MPKSANTKITFNINDVLFMYGLISKKDHTFGEALDIISQQS